MKTNILPFLFAVLIFACSTDETEQGKSSASLYYSSSSQVIAQQAPLSCQGQSYKAVKMGSQIWLAENLNEEPTSGKWWCYGDSPSGYYPERCSMYGKLYDWVAAMAVCPDGWKLPSKDDFDNLSDFGDFLKSSVGWNAALGGLRYEDEFRGFEFLDREGYWWSSTENGGTRAYYHNFIANGNKLDRYDAEKTRGFSVRCIKK